MLEDLIVALALIFATGVGVGVITTALGRSAGDRGHK